MGWWWLDTWCEAEAEKEKVRGRRKTRKMESSGGSSQRQRWMGGGRVVAAEGRLERRDVAMAAKETVGVGSGGTAVHLATVAGRQRGNRRTKR